MSRRYKSETQTFAPSDSYSYRQYAACGSFNFSFGKCFVRLQQSFFLGTRITMISISPGQDSSWLAQYPAFIRNQLDSVSRSIRHHTLVPCSIPENRMKYVHTRRSTGSLNIQYVVSLSTKHILVERKCILEYKFIENLRYDKHIVLEYNKRKHLIH